MNEPSEAMIHAAAVALRKNVRDNGSLEEKDTASEYREAARQALEAAMRAAS